MIKNTLKRLFQFLQKRNSKYKALKQIAIIPAGSAGNAKTMYDDVLSKQVDGLELIAFLFDYDKGGLEGWKNIGNIKSGESNSHILSGQLCKRIRNQYKKYSR